MQAGFYQDYIWFLSGLSWLVVGLSWSRLATRDSRLAWIPWASLAGTLAAVAQVLALSTVPSAKGQAPPHEYADLGLGVLTAVQIAGWWWCVDRERSRIRRLVIAGMVAACALAAAGARFQWPSAGAAALAIAATIPGLRTIRRDADGWNRAAVALTLACIPLSNWGPWAGLGFPSLRWAEFAGGSWLAILQLSAATAALATLLRRVGWERIARGSAMYRSDVRVFTVVLAVWLAAGFGIGFMVTQSAQREFEAGALGRVRMAAALLPLKELEWALGPGLRLDEIREFRQFQGRLTRYGVNLSGSSERTARTRDVLQRIQELNPDVDGVFIATIRDEWLVGAIFPSSAPGGGRALSLERTLEAGDRTAWEQALSQFQRFRSNAYGASLQAWAALTGGDGQMLGWLVFDYGVGRWISIQTHSRVQTFAVMALGASLCVLLFLHRFISRQREAAATEASAARRASEMKSRFVASVSHELRTPLQTIRSYTELLRARVCDSETKRLVIPLENQLETMQRLVGDLLDLSAMEAGTYSCIPLPMSCVDIIEDVVSSFRESAAQKGLVLQTEVPAGFPPLLEGDAVRLRQLLSNLISNAVKYTDRGDVKINLALAHQDERSCKFVIAVTDTGPGVPEDGRATLFQPFTRLDRRPDREGFGLGLALASGLARVMGGKLSLERTGPDGSRFRLDLCWPISRHNSQTVVSAPILRTPARNILVCDDHAPIRALFIEYLAECGGACDGASTGSAAVDILIEGRHDAAVLDLGLPDIDGLEVVRRVRAMRGPSVLRIIGVTAHAGQSMREAAFEAGMDELLVKPVGLATLARALGLEKSPTIPTRSFSDLTAEIRRLFLEECPLLIKDMDAALARLDRLRMRRIAHHIANSASAAQRPNLARSCAALECMVDHQDASTLEIAWRKVRVELIALEERAAETFSLLHTTHS
jgi:signal transduction histidine kinase/CheY-like chemotaxis protein